MKTEPIPIVRKKAPSRPSGDTDGSMVPRKRRRAHGGVSSLGNRSIDRTSYCELLDTANVRVSPSTTSLLAGERAGKRSTDPNALPVLLYQREIGASWNSSLRRRFQISPCTNIVTWNDRVLKRQAPQCLDPNRKDASEVGWRWNWRPYAVHSVPFSQLGTPMTDAILALDRTGSYMMSLGGGRAYSSIDNQERGDQHYLPTQVCHPVLALRFYGVPSPASLKKQANTEMTTAAVAPGVVSPLLHTIPLLFETSDSDENRNFTAPRSLLGSEGGVSAASTPVQIITSSDSVLGVAFLHHSSSSSYVAPIIPASSLVGSPAVRDEDTLGTLIIFPMPFSGCCSLSLSVDRKKYEIPRCRLTKTFKCANVHVGGWNAHTMRNLLWRTNLIPYKMACDPMRDEESKELPSLDGGSSAWDVSGKIHHSNSICDTFLDSPGHILFNDEDDGYRVAWITLGKRSDSPVAGRKFAPTGPVFTFQPLRQDIVTLPDENVWDAFWSDCSTGCAKLNDTALDEAVYHGRQCLHIAFEAYLHVDALLSDILNRRRHNATLSPLADRRKKRRGFHVLPDFFYNLVSVGDNGQTAVLVVVFSNNKLKNVEGKGHRARQSKIPASLGIFIQINLFNHSYEEIEWVQHPSRSDSVFLRKWSNALALNRRMRECGVGVFCVGNGFGRPLKNCGISAYECNTGENEADDRNPDLWKPFVSAKQDKQPERKIAPRRVAFSSLYPDCDVVSNRAVTSGKPLSMLGCRNSPTRLSYK